MKRETLIWTVLFLAGGAFLTYRAALTEQGVGKQFVIPREIAGEFNPTTKTIQPLVEGKETDPKLIRKVTRYDRAIAGIDRAELSISRSIGIWVAALMTLFVFTYLYRDNVFYKLAESIIVGVSAGYWMIQYFWEVLIGKVFVNIAPDQARYAFMPDTPLNAKPDYIYIIPAVLGCLVFCRLVPKISWLGRWPLAFVVGTTAGLKLILFLNADFVQQVRSTILPLIVFASDQSINWKQSIQNIVLVTSVVSSVTYFYFSVEHKGVIGRISRMGIWVLMISFGASFALTVMGRITLLTMRLQFLFNDWLGLSGV